MVAAASIAIAVLAGCVIGFASGTVGGGGAIIAVPILVYLLGQTPIQATTASLIIVGITALAGARYAYRLGNVMLVDGLGFGAASVVGAIGGSMLSHRVSPKVLMLSFAAVLIVTAVTMMLRLFRRKEAVFKDLPPMVTFRPFSLDGGRMIRLIATATLVGMLTGFLGVGGGFLIVPAMTLVLGLDMKRAVGTSLVAQCVAIAAAMTTRVIENPPGLKPDATIVGLMTAFAVIGAMVGAGVAHRANSRQLSIGFAILVAVVAIYTCTKAGLSLL